MIEGTAHPSSVLPTRLMVRNFAALVCLLVGGIYFLSKDALYAHLASDARFAMAAGTALGALVAAVLLQRGLRVTRLVRSVVGLAGAATILLGSLQVAGIEHETATILVGAGSLLATVVVSIAAAELIDALSKPPLTRTLGLIAVSTIVSGLALLGCSFLDGKVAGGVCCIAFVCGLALAPDGIVEHDPARFAESPNDESLQVPVSSIISTVPVLGFSLLLFTEGSITSSDSAASWSPNLAPTLIVIGLVALAIAKSRMGNLPETTLSYALFRVGAPAVFLFALFCKVIPVDDVSYTFYRQVMEVCFRVAGFLLAVYIVHTVRTSGIPAHRVLPCILVLFACVLGVGAITGLIESSTRRIILGVVTSFFLLYCAYAIGRNIVLYNKPAEPEGEHTPPPTMDSVLATIGERCGLSPREAEVLSELARGHSSGYIAQALYISDNTARAHMKSIYRKLGVKSREDVLDLIWAELDQA